MARRTSRPARPVDDERSDARERALILLYEAETKGIAPSEVLAAQISPADELTTALVLGVEANKAQLEAAFRQKDPAMTSEASPRSGLAEASFTRAPPRPSRARSTGPRSPTRPPRPG